ncbi:helix-turn-helix domain-containing protein [Kitasatospora sp. NPDC059795]|uniref:helix-turn-helix domain-containing protein n=1 Tax=Kitasatospora sp. NPDC059795 TaxID=3346949 RepID=UPI0036590ED1
MNAREQAAVPVRRSEALSPAARELFLRIINERSGHLENRQEFDEETVEELVEIGLLVPETDNPNAFVAADPARLSSALSTRWQHQALDLLSRAISVSSDFSELAEKFHAPGQSDGVVEYIRGKALINQRVHQLINAGVREALAMQPGGPRPPEMLAAGLEEDLKTIGRGTATRTIYHASTRYHQPTRDYVATLSAVGWQFRTLDEPYTRLMIFDRRVAVIPAVDDMSLAAFVHDQSVIEFLTEEVFERSWGRALEFDGERTVPQEVVSRLRQTIIDLLLSGTNHRVIARRLGISERTLARHIAEMREEYNVESLFQLGYVLGRSASADGVGALPASSPGAMRMSLVRDPHA